MADHLFAENIFVEDSQYKTLHLDFAEDIDVADSAGVENVIPGLDVDIEVSDIFRANPPSLDILLGFSISDALTIIPPSLGVMDSEVEVSGQLSLDRVYGLFDEEIEVTDSLSLDNKPLPLMSETVLVRAWMTLEKPTAIHDFTLITNTDTGGFSQYNWPVDEVFGTIGISESGVYSLSSSDDDGEAIDAYIELPWSQLGDGNMARVADIMALGQSEKDMEVKVGVIENGEGWRYCYDMPCNGAEINELYTRVGRGMRSHLTNFRLANKDGGDFKLRDVTIRYVLTGRRRYT